MRPILAVLACALPVLADDTVIIKLKLDPAVGVAQKSSEVSKDRGVMKFEGPDGKTIEIHPEGSQTVNRDTILRVDKDGRPTQFLRTYEKATESEDGKTKTFSYQGATLLYEKGADGKFRVGVGARGKEAAEIAPKDAERLFDKANKPGDRDAILRQLVTGKPVRVGDSWKLALKPMAEAMEAELDESRSSISAKLTAVATKGKARVGTFEIEQRLAVKGFKQRGLEATFDPPADYTMTATVELAIDGSSAEYTIRSKGGLKGQGKLAESGQTAKVEFDMSGDINVHVSAEEPAKTAAPSTVAWLPRPGEWLTIKPKDGLFSVEFPTAPTEQSHKDPRASSMVTWTSSTEGGRVNFFVAVTDFAGADATKLDPKAMVASVPKTQKEVRDVKDVTIDGHPGIEFRSAEKMGDREVEVWQRVVMANGRMVHQVVIADKGKGKPADADRFFRSFKILVKPKAKDD